MLDGQDLPGLSTYLRGLGWLEVSEELSSASRAGEGNMNCTLRVETNQRSFILKQARPWVEKYPHIAAPLDRALVECSFYALAASVPNLACRMPKLIASDTDARLLCLEDLGKAQDFTSIYETGRILEQEFEMLLDFLSTLHDRFRASMNRSAFSNTEMRKLNHEYIFVQPLHDNYVFDEHYKAAVRALGELYLSEGECLLHGDFFPGSWLKTASGVRVIDPEFCFFGPPEFDLGVMLAHFIMSKDNRITAEKVLNFYRGPVNKRLMLQFAGVEIMRRLLGVARLPLHLDGAATAQLLVRSREMVLNIA